MKYLYIQNHRHSLKASFGCLLWNSRSYENNLMDCSKMGKSVPLLVLMEPLFFLRKRKMVVFECVSIIALSILKQLRTDTPYLESTRSSTSYMAHSASVRLTLPVAIGRSP